MTIMQIRRFFAMHPKLYDAMLVTWVLIVTAASIYTIASWR